MEKKTKTKAKKENKKKENGFWEKFKTNYKKNGMAILLMAMILVLIAVIPVLKCYKGILSISKSSSTDDDTVIAESNDDEFENILTVGDEIALTQLASGIANEFEIEEYTIKDESIVSIDEDMMVTALVEGETEIDITYANEEEETITVRVVTNTSDAATSSATNRIYFLSLQRGNAILIQTVDGNNNPIFGLIDAGTDNADEDTTSTVTCSNLVSEINNILSSYGVTSLDFVMISHLDADHYKCLTGQKSKVTKSTNLLNNSYFTIKSVILKEYTSTQKTAYNKINSYSSAMGVPVYTLSSDSNYNVTMKKVSASGSGTTNGTINNLSYTITNNTSNVNNSYMKFTFGKFTFYAMNIIQRNLSDDNYNSLVLYGEIKYSSTKTYKIYLPGDIYNTSSKIKVTNTASSLYNAKKSVKVYGFADHTEALTTFDASTLLSSPKKSTLADYYAYYTATQFSKGTVDLYVASHHGTTQTNNGYITNLLINSSTKIVFTFAYNYISSLGYGDYDTTAANCSGYSQGSSEKFRCLNDKTVNRIMSALGTKSLTVFYQNYSFSGISSMSQTLKFGFDSSSITHEGAVKNTTYAKYTYSSKISK